MTERSILFNAEMVRAILDGCKVQTRRPVMPQPQYILGAQFHQSSLGDIAMWHSWPHRVAPGVEPVRLKSPFGVPGDLLWVRETWTVPGYEQYKPFEIMQVNKGAHIRYRATGKNAHDPEYATVYKWRPSIHMPRWASRISLRVKRVWAERAQSISATDALFEGTPGAWIEQSEYPGRLVENPNVAHVHFFSILWDSIYAKKGLGWNINPWVWAAEFEVEQ